MEIREQSLEGGMLLQAGVGELGRGRDSPAPLNLMTYSSLPRKALHAFLRGESPEGDLG